MVEMLGTLKKLYDDRGEEIEQWLGEKRAAATPFFTTSVDLRHSGLRLAPVDTNLFPAGFNNISPAARARASRFIRHFLDERYPDVKRVLIVPENHTRNIKYLENLSVLMLLFEQIGIDVQLGSLAAPAGEPIVLEVPSSPQHGGRTLTEYPMQRQGKKLLLENGFAPDLIILNNDMTSGEPEILRNVEQPIQPPADMGWHRRRKSVHFSAYHALAEDFGEKFSMDPWLISAEFHRCGLVNFKDKVGLDCVAEGVEKVLARIREKHKQYGITEEPYVFIKAESGTYGMGIMTARKGEDVLEINKKTRNKMEVIKEGAHVSDVIIQEGVSTIDRVDGKPAEPVVYMIDGVPVGGMFRVNGERDGSSNLNASGMEFTGMCDELEDECGQWRAVEDCHFRSYGIIAAMAALASAHEDYLTGADGAGI